MSKKSPVLYTGLLSSIGFLLMDPSFDYEENIHACAKGKRNALHALYEQEAPRMLSISLKILHNKSLAEDVVHDAFIKIWAQSKTYDVSLGSARGWIYTITRNLALNTVKYSNRQIQTEPDYIHDLIDTKALDNYFAKIIPEQATNHQLDEKSLLECMNKLKPESKKCILLAYLEGYTQNEIASLLSKPLGTVKSWIKRGLKSLQECLQ